MNRGFWKTTFVYSLGYLGLRAISFLLLPLYTNLLTPKEAGIVFIIYTLLAFFNTIYSKGMDSALLKFFHDNNSTTVISTSIIFSILYSIPLSLLLFIINYFLLFDIIKSTFDNINIITYLLIIVLICDMLSSRLMHVIRLLERPFYYLAVSCVNVISSISLNIYFIKYLNFGLYGAILALVFTVILQLFLLMPIVIMYTKISYFNYKLLKKMLAFSSPFLPASIFFILIELSDRWMLGWLSSLENVGLYSVGYKIGAIMLLFVRAFNLNWQPFYLKHTNDHHQFESIGTKSIISMIYITTVLSILWPLILKIQINNYYLIGEQFWDGGAIIPIISISYIFYGIFILQMPSIYLKNKQHWVPYFWGIGFLFNFVGNCIFIPKYGFLGAALATLLSYFVMALLLIYKNKSWLPIQYRIQPIFIIVCMSVLAYSLSQLYNNTLMTIICAYLIFGISYIYYIHKKL